MDAVFNVLSTAGFPTSIAGTLIFLFFWLKKYESGVRAEIIASLARLQEEKLALQLRIRELEDEAEERESKIDELRATIRATEDDAFQNRRRAEEAERRWELEHPRG